MEPGKNATKISEMEGYPFRISMAMDKRNFSQKALAESVGLTQPEISNFKRGKALPRPVVAQRIAKTLYCSFQWLNYGFGEPNFSARFYQLDEFWRTPHERLAYIVWSNNLTLREFLELFPDKAAPMWFEATSNRFPNAEQIRKISMDFNLPDFFLLNGWPYVSEIEDINRSINFYIQEYKKVFKVTLSPDDLD